MAEFTFAYWSLPPELSLLLDIVLRKAPQVPGDPDWERFDALLKQHRLQPLLIRGLKTMDAADLDRFPVLQAYRDRQNQYVMESMERLQALAEVSAALAREGIPMISMKGPLLSMELYGDPSLRTSRDLDVMVAQEDLSRAGGVLTALGYVPEENLFHKTPLRRKYYSLIEPEKHTVYNRGRICLELHWKSNYQSEESFRDLWERREERQLLGRPIAVMGTVDRYPALIIHAAEHGFHRLRWLLDLYELQKKPSFSWERLHRQLSERGLGALLLETMLVMYRLDLPDLPDLEYPGLRLTRTPEGIRLSVDQAAEGRRAAALCEAVFPMWQGEARWGDPRQRVHDRLLPRSLIRKTPLQWFLLHFGPSVYELKLTDLPDPLFWLYFIIRPINWLRRKLRSLF